MTLKTTFFHYTTGVRDLDRISPDDWTTDQCSLDRPGNDEIQLRLFHDYLSNLNRYLEWRAYFRERRPPTLVIWGQNDPIFGAPGTEAFRRDLPEAEIHLLEIDHVALEDHAAVIAARIAQFLGERAATATAS